ncbi:MAG: (2Fe-2S)-binding protein [bacterium]|nr:(2Fe-2S)-binding protein [bacterium]
MKISFNLNHEKRTELVEPNQILLHFLRERMGLKSPKCGCGKGECGTCTVLIDDISVKSCLVLAVEIDGRSVTTLEGLMKDGLTPIQEAFINGNSFQCGYCAPGMIVASTELVRKNPNPSKEEIKDALSGNLCRCTGYSPIIDALHKCVSKKEPTHSGGGGQ